MNYGELGHCNALGERDASPPPHMQTLVGKAEMLPEHAGPDRVDNDIVGVSLYVHPDKLYTMFNPVNPASLLAPLGPAHHTGGMLEQITNRIRQRMKELGLSQSDLAARLDWTPQRFGNYYHGRRMPDVPSLVRMAKELDTSTDWLVGLSSDRTAVVNEVLRELLSAAGVPDERASLIFDAMLEALRLLAVLPSDGDATTRTRMAAHAAWHSKGSPRPN